MNSPAFNSRPARALLKSNLVLTGATAKLLKTLSSALEANPPVPLYLTEACKTPLESSVTVTVIVTVIAS